MLDYKIYISTNADCVAEMYVYYLVAVEKFNKRR